MDSIMDFLDDFIFGPLNWINRFEGLLSAARYQDTGHRFKIYRIRKIPPKTRCKPHSLNDVRELLGKYKIPCYGLTHDATYMYFSVKKRQARWAEYVMLRAGIGEQLCQRTKETRNEGWAAQYQAPPPAWRDKRR